MNNPQRKKRLHLNRQRRIIRKVCAAGVVGVLAANITISETGKNYTEKIETQKYHASAGTEIQQVVVPVKPETSNFVIMSKRDELKATTSAPSISGIKEDLNSSDGTGIKENSENSNGAGVTGDVNSSGTTENIGSPDGAGVTDNSNTTNQPNSSEKPDLSGNENGTGKPDIPEESDTPNQSGTPEDSDNLNDSEKPNPSENEDGTGKPDTSDEIDSPEEPETPEESDSPNDTEKPDDSENQEIPDDSNQSEAPDNTGNSDNLNQEENPDNSINSGKPDIPNLPDNSNGGNSNGISKPSWSLDLKPSFGTNISNEIIDVNQFQPEKISAEKIKNASLILNQKLMTLPKVVEDYRFWTVARKYAFAKENLIIREAIVSEEDNDDSVRAVGKLRKNGLLYILKEEDNGWVYVESGRVRGFVRLEEVLTDEEANQQLEIYQKKAKERAERLKQEYTGIEGTAPMARELLSWQENEAYTYLRATVNQTVVEKKYALAEIEKVEVKEEKDEESRVIGVIPKGGLCYILEDEKEEWSYIESGDVRGFVKSDSIECGEEIQKQVEEKHEDTFSMAKEKIKPEENKACYYTLTSTKSGVPSGEIRRSILEFAAQFIGNPYVWGGTSLTEGADCSGFVQSIYKQYGYDLPRVSRDQAQYGTKIPVEDALPGDLIFYANSGNIYHVVMYAGEGKTIEAMSTDMGIVQANVSKENAVWATRVLKDDGYASNISDVNATQDMYGKNLGTFKLTYYCACELCCNIETGITATGAPVVEGRTIAVDPKVIPYGTQVIIGGHVFTAEDCGGAIKENRIDIYVNEHEKALELGVNYADVYLKK